LQKIEALANEAVLQGIPVETAWMPRNDAENQYGFRLYQGGAVPGKEIRVVKTGDWDIEACAGTHLKNTSEIGFIKIVHSERVQDGVERLAYSIGPFAVKAVQRSDALIAKLSEILNAPTEKLDATAEKLVKELKEANAERRKLIKEVAVRDSVKMEDRVEVTKTKDIAGVKLVVRDFEKKAVVDRMIKTANEIIRRDEAAVTLFYGSDGKTGRVIVMAGRLALEKNANADEIAREASAVIGGGGGGRPNFAQGGGPKVEKLSDAVEKAEETLRKQLKMT
jgi:alanyl-tRNA synthetase